MAVFKKILAVAILIIVVLVLFFLQHEINNHQYFQKLTLTKLADAPTTNPADPYVPMPLRIGTIGDVIFHRPFCPNAKQSLANNGLANRINFWTREQIATSNRQPDVYCLSNIFDCSDLDPASFSASTGDPYCGVTIRRDYGLSGADPALAGKVLCNLQGYIGAFVDDEANCIRGKIRGSNPSCNQSLCNACIASDCSSECAGCVKITLAPLNKIALGLGDATRNGQITIEDYLYYHECHSGVNITASMPCQNVFDWDSDGDVDINDYAKFGLSFNTGNETWASSNFPNAKINPPQLELPLRVGTDGLQDYHRIDCPVVNNSWATLGVDQRIDFYNWDQVETSGLTPDTTVCLPGDRDDPDGSLQDCTLDDDGDGTLNCSSVATFITTDDAGTRGGNFADDNHGSNPELGFLSSGGDWDIQAFLKFDFSSVRAQIEKVELKLEAYKISNNSVALWITDTAWTEDTITHNTRPALSNQIATTNTNLIMIVIDVTTAALADADKIISFGLINAGQPYGAIWSKEKIGALAPTLEVTLAADLCPLNLLKTDPGTCGCNKVDTDPCP